MSSFLKIATTTGPFLWWVIRDDMSEHKVQLKKKVVFRFPSRFESFLYRAVKLNHIWWAFKKLNRSASLKLVKDISWFNMPNCGSYSYHKFSAWAFAVNFEAMAVTLMSPAQLLNKLVVT